MVTAHRSHASQDAAMWLALGLAALAALSYVLMGLHVLGVGDLASSEAPAGIIYVAAGGYLLGGLLILLRRRWLWIVGAVMNALVMLVFFQAYVDRTSVLLSAGGLVFKTAEILLELALLYLIVVDWSDARRAD